MLKKVLVFLVGFSLSMLPVANASERDDLMSVRKYYLEFFKSTFGDMQAIAEISDEMGKSPVVLQVNNEDAFALNTILADVWTLASFVELAQDVLLASRVEAGIAIDVDKRTVVFSDALKRFPGPVPQLADRIMSGWPRCRLSSLFARSFCESSACSSE